MLSATFHLGLPDDPLPPDFYGRADNPTWRALEAAIGDLDGGECVVFASGMAAVAAVLRLRPGPVVLPVRRLLRDPRAGPRRGRTTCARCPPPDPWPDDVLDGAGLVLLETPSNPGLDVCDIAALAAAAHAAGALVAVDNTTATPLGQRPLALGADLTLASDTKALAGHDDVVLGHVSTRDPALAARLRELRTRGGAGPGPMEAWLAHRGLAHARPAPRPAGRQRRRARRGAARRTRPSRRCGGRAIPTTRPTTVARRQMRRWNGVVGLTLASEAAVGRFLAASRLVASATSFGGVRTSADRRQRWGDAVPPGFLRLSVGCEDADDLVADVAAGRARHVLSRVPYHTRVTHPGYGLISRREVVA